MNIKEKAYNFKLNKTSSLFRAFCVALAVVFGLAVFPLGKIVLNKTSADSTPSLSVSSLGNVNLSIQTSDEGSLSIVKDTVTVSTNNDNGYKLFLATTNNIMYRNGFNASTATDQDKIQSVAGTYDNPTSMVLSSSVHGMWGYAVAGASSFNTIYEVDSPNLSSKFAAAPAYSDTSFNEQLVYAATTQMTDNDTDIYYGVMANTQLNSGAYTTNLIYTVLAEPSGSSADNNNTVTLPTEDLIEGQYGSNKSVTMTTDLLTTDNIGKVEVVLSSDDGNIVAVPEGNITVVTQAPLTVTFDIPNNLEIGDYNIIVSVPKLGKEYIAGETLAIKKVYTIIYNANEGQNAPVDTTKVTFKKTTSVTVTDQVPTRAGFTLVGWGTSADSETPSYYAGDNVSMNAENPTITLYAIWQANDSYVLSYNGNGTSVTNLPSASSQPILGEEPQYINIDTANIPQYDRLEFMGYAESADASDPDYRYEAGAFNPDKVEFSSSRQNVVLYAVWSKVGYTLNYDDNASGDRVENLPESERQNARHPSIELSIKPLPGEHVPERRGYRFLGWDINRRMLDGQTVPTYAYDSNTQTFTPSTITITADSSDVTLFAVWASVNTYMLSYVDSNAATPEPYMEETEDLSVTVSISEAVIPSRQSENGVSYRFVGYSNYDTGTGRVDVSNSFAIADYPYDPDAAPGHRFGNSPIVLTSENSQKTIYAVWEKTYTYSLNYYADEGTNVPESDTTTTTNETAQLIVTDSEPFREGYSFAGWADAPNTTPTYTAGDKVDFVSSESLSKNVYAIWRVAYVLNYSGNNGSGEPEREVYQAEDWEYTHEFVINEETIPTRDGYVFLGYASSNTETCADTTSCYTYNANAAPGEKFSPKSIWLTADNREATLYAIWALSYQLVYKVNGGSNPPLDEEYHSGTSVDQHTFTINSRTLPERRGYRFMGYSYNPAASGTDFTWSNDMGQFDNDQVVATKDNPVVTLYAVWAKQYELNYSNNGGDRGSEPGPANMLVVGDYWDVEITTRQIPTKGEEKFLGYSDDAEALTPQYVYDSTTNSFTPAVVRISADEFETTYKTLFAVWGAQSYTYTIAYYTNEGGNVPESTILESQDRLVTLNITASTIPSRTGHVFVGYDENPDAPVPTYMYNSDNHTFEPSSIELTSDRTTRDLYAIWAEFTDFALTYDLNYDTTDTAPDGETTVGEEIASKTYTLNTTQIPSRSGYIFGGYAKQNIATEPDFVWDSEANTFSPSTITLNYTENTVTLYAIWMTTYELRFDSNDVDTGVFYTDTALAAGEGYSFTIPVERVPGDRPGLRFLGYAESNDATEAMYVYHAGDSFVPEKINLSSSNPTKTLYAVWGKPYVLNYSANGGFGGPQSEEHVGPLSSTSHDFEIVTKAIPEKDANHVFLGYAYDENAISPNFAWDGSGFTPSTVNVTGITQLYAVWGKQYKLIYDANKGDNAPRNDIAMDSANSHTFTLNTTTIPTRAGFAFMGYAETPEATSATFVYSAGTFLPFTTITVLESENPVTLYAVWQETYNYSVSYDLNYNASGTGVEAPATQTNTTTSNSYTFYFDTNSVPTREGYVLLGYSETNTSTAPEYIYDSARNLFNPDNIRMRSDSPETRLYAIWAKVFTLNYNANGGSSAPGTDVANAIDVSHTFSINTTLPVRDGYKFLGYDEDDRVTTPYYVYNENRHSFSPSSIEATESDSTKTLYAIWAKIYTYTFRLVDNSGASEVVVYTETRQSTATSETFNINGEPSTPSGGGSAIDSITYLQEMNVDVCESMNVGQSYTLKDQRDNKSYTVARLKMTKDGSVTNCWMTQDLALVLSDSTPLTSANTDLNSVSEWLPSSSTASEAINFESNTAPQSRAISDTVVLYNWTAAIASNDSSALDGEGGTAADEAPNSICPSGWKLPSAKDTSSSYANLFDAYDLLDTSTTGGRISDAPLVSGGLELIKGAPIYLTLSGLSYSGMDMMDGDSVLLWYSNVSNSSTAYSMMIAFGSMAAINADATRGFGAPVRCVMR